jgi:hypothetical protein
MMGVSTMNVHATLQPDGLTLRLEEKLTLPPGRVSVTIQAEESTAGPTMLEVLKRIHREQFERGRLPMTEEEMVTGIAEVCDDDKDYEERWREIWSQQVVSKRAES